MESQGAPVAELMGSLWELKELLWCPEKQVWVSGCPTAPTGALQATMVPHGSQRTPIGLQEWDSEHSIESIGTRHTWSPTSTLLGHRVRGHGVRASISGVNEGRPQRGNK